MKAPKFTYNQKVRIVEGFYRGLEGYVQWAGRFGWPWARRWKYDIIPSAQSGWYGHNLLMEEFEIEVVEKP